LHTPQVNPVGREQFRSSPFRSTTKQNKKKGEEEKRCPFAHVLWLARETTFPPDEGRRVVCLPGL
jgi:hypothetical protein